MRTNVKFKGSLKSGERDLVMGKVRDDSGLTASQN